MPKFRKKPVTIDAVHYDLYPDSAPYKWLSDRPPWIEEAYDNGTLANVGRDGDIPRNIHIKTLEGTMICSPGDWIIQGVKGEIYPCKPDIFSATYEAA
jgi:hypothetical protein